MRLLIVEDERALRQILNVELTRENHEVVAVGTGSDALKAIDGDDFDLVVTDLRLPDMEGIDIVRRTRESGNPMPFLVMTAYASVAKAVAALKAGAADFLIKPIRVPDLARRIQQIHDLGRLNRENRLLKRLIQHETRSYWLADNDSGRKARQLISKVSGTDMTVLIDGESGTGKGVTARLIHAASRRADGPFVPVNCAAIPEALMESELFGYRRGAFTGADRPHEGLFVSASGGTLFLDEISEMSPAMQAKLLHAIEEKSVRPLGSTRELPVDARILAATNRDLERLVGQGRFRGDLLYRFNIFQIHLPPLREQMGELRSAAEFFLAKHTRHLPDRPIKFDEAVWDALAVHDWPGNLRELENIIERALVFCDGPRIYLSDLPAAFQTRVQPDMGPTTGGLKERVRVFERQTIIQAVEDSGGDRRAAAKALKISLSTLYHKLNESPPAVSV